MKVYIQTDIEGVAGFTSFEDLAALGMENYQHRMRMYRLLTGEVKAAALAAESAGAATIYVNDSHGSGYNILFEELPESCETIHGRGNTRPAWLTDLDASFDALIQVGMHAMGGDLRGVCPHSKWEVNQGRIYLSEASMAMALAGDLGIPTVFVSGDQILTAEIAAKSPRTVIGVVKHAHGPNNCRSLTPERAQRIIYEGVREGLRNRTAIPPYRIKGPVTLNLLDSPAHFPPLKPVLKKPVTGKTISEACVKALARFPWNSFGRLVMDYYRYPSNLTGRRPGDRGSHVSKE